ncbi:5-oxoprolinase subunit PxpB [Tamlana sp. 2201CG12-4]|uniref:5-oxoprolinase subunit PxpB n=1 Tax=Tamlana sp. 2201CG12-4 TaxID=3112582 RepID=UPI002DB83CA8|nr:5-oxoprolinase subunit PxpB [Tamlana sp. 2201CG12-4]MEC3907808.1 5-oxoprolinase subunit PxpB [Tamlana sp. 2201CG12-4]
MRFNLSYKPFGERAILIEWPSEISKTVLSDILFFKENIKKHKLGSIVEIRSAYNSLLVIYNDDTFSFEEEISLLEIIYSSNKLSKESPSKLWKIPVCYEDHFALDLDVMSEAKQMSKAKIVKLHSETVYTVYFIGFLPGFLYLGGLDERLVAPRKGTPRMKIKKGAVAIGGSQTGVYPNESPGGWNIIGNSPIDFFNSKNEIPCFAKAGDSIQFYEISFEEYNTIKTLVDAGVYQIENEVLND